MVCTFNLYLETRIRNRKGKAGRIRVKGRKLSVEEPLGTWEDDYIQ